MQYVAAPPPMLRLPALMAATGLPRSTVYWHVEKGLLPRPIKISERSVAWPGDEIAQLLAARRSGASAERIKALVAMLEAERAATAAA